MRLLAGIAVHCGLSPLADEARKRPGPEPVSALGQPKDSEIVILKFSGR